MSRAGINGMRSAGEDILTVGSGLTELFSSLQEEPMASAQTPMLDLGTYPLHAIVDMFTFDMTTHLRYDILAPLGPFTRGCHRSTKRG
jgi:hypothetical protein